MLKRKNIESFLPVFTGFYNTIFESDEDSEIEEGKTYDDYEWDNKGYQESVSKGCTKFVSEKLNELFGITAKYQNLVSPKYYNYTNDSINVKYKLANDSMSRLMAYLTDNKEAFNKYLVENYTSGPGFASFYEPNADVWLFNYMTKTDKIEHWFGAVLDFVLEHEGCDVEWLYYKVKDAGYADISGTLKESAE